MLIYAEPVTMYDKTTSSSLLPVTFTDDASLATGWTVRFRIPAGANNSLFSEIVQTGSGAHLTSYLIGTGSLARGQSGRSVNLTSDFHLAPRLRMIGAIPLLHHYAFMVGTGTTSPLLHTLLIQGVTGGTDQTSGGCSLC